MAHSQSLPRVPIKKEQERHSFFSCSEMADSAYNTSEIKFWLEFILAKQNLISIKVPNVLNKQHGYMGDVLSVDVSATTKNDDTKELRLVLKCSQTEAEFRENIPVQLLFENEIHVYTKVLPELTEFQKEKGIEDVFDSFPKFYGSYREKNLEVVALENLVPLGYSVHDQRKPMSRKHLNLVLETYGKWHAISAAMQDQLPDQFRRLVDGFKDIATGFQKDVDIESFIGYRLYYVYDLIGNDISQISKEKLENLSKQIKFIVKELISDENYFGVVTHGDCWNNNFMFRYKDNDENQPEKVAMIDFQLAKVTSPVTDLSYFIYSCISIDDLNDFDDILKAYYNHFSDYMKKLGSDADKIYPFSQLETDWKIFSKFGILMTLLNGCLDLDEDGSDGHQKDGIKRLLHVVQHVTDRNYI